MKTFVLGALVGAVVVWQWRDDVQGFFEKGRARAAEGLETVVDRARPQIQSAAKAAQEILRPAERESGTPESPRQVSPRTEPGFPRSGAV